MRILIVVPEYRTDRGRSGGIDAVVQFVLRSLNGADGYSCTIASLRMSRSARESRRLVAPNSWLRRPQLRWRREDEVDVVDIGAALAEIELTRYLPRRNLEKLAAKHDLALVVSGTPAPAYSLRYTDIPVVSHIATLIQNERSRLLESKHGLARWYWRESTRAISALDRRGLRRADVVLVENLEMVEACQGLGTRDVRLLAPGIDTAVFRPDQRKAYGGYILMVGRLADPRKDLPTLLRAYSRARDHHGVKHKLVLAGLTAPSNADLDMAKKLGILDLVDLRVGVAPEELIRLYQGADLFVLSSREEGLGIVLLEAMACAVPVVSTATAGARYAIGDSDAGETVPLGPDAWLRLGDAIGRWLRPDERTLRARESGRQRVEEHFSLEVAGTRLRRVVDEAKDLRGAQRRGTSGRGPVGGW